MFFYSTMDCTPLDPPSPSVFQTKTDKHWDHCETKWKLLNTPPFTSAIFRPFMEKPNCFLLSPGCLGTAGALMYGLRAFKQGKTRQSQLLMRGRIFAQGFTVVAIIFGVFATALKKDWAALGLCSFTAKLFATGKNKNKKFLIRQVQIVPLCCCGGEWNVLKDLTEQIFKSPPPPPKKGSPFSGLP